MSVEFKRLEYHNNKVADAELEEHQEMIKRYILSGYDYLGFIPVKFGPSGKTLAIDLIFNKKESH